MDAKINFSVMIAQSIVQVIKLQELVSILKKDAFVKPIHGMMETPLNVPTHVLKLLTLK